MGRGGQPEQAEVSGTLDVYGKLVLKDSLCVAANLVYCCTEIEQREMLNIRIVRLPS